MPTSTSPPTPSGRGPRLRGRTQRHRPVGALLPAEQVVAWDRTITNEDREILETTDYDVGIDTRRRTEFHMARDRPSLVMRERLLAAFREHGEDEVHL